MSRRADFLAVLALLLAPLCLLGPSLFGGRVFVPFDLAQFPPVQTRLTAAQLEQVKAHQNPDVTEVPVTFVPEWRLARQELRKGRLPEWNPYARGGTAMLATSVAGFLYPLNWILYAHADPQDGLATLAYLSLCLAGLLLFGFLRALGVAALGALFGALAWQYSGTLYANLHFFQRTGALIWLPGMLWALLRIAKPTARRRGPAVALLALCTGMTWLAGFPSYATATTLLAGLFGLWLLLGALPSHGVSGTLKLGSLFLLGIVLGLGLACVQLLPMVDFFPESNRTLQPSLADAARGAWDPMGLLGYLMPDPFGRPDLTGVLPYDRSPLVYSLFSRTLFANGGSPALPFLPNYNFTEYTVFPGTLTLFLAAIALMVRGGAVSWGFRWFAALAAVFLMLLGAGEVQPHGLYTFAPFSTPMRFLGPVAMLVAALAALGLHDVERLSRLRRMALWLFGLGLSLLCFLAWLWLHAHGPDELLSTMKGPIAARYLDSPDAANVTPTLVASWLSSPGKGTCHVVAHDLLRANLLYAALALMLGAAWVGLWPYRSSPRWRRNMKLAAILLTLGQLLFLARGVSGGRALPFAHDNTAVHAFLRKQRDRFAAQGGFTVARAAKQASLATALPPGSLVPEHIRDLNIYTFTDRRAHLPFERLYGKSQLVRGYWINALPDDARLQRPLLDLLGVRYLLSTVKLEHAGKPVGPAWRGPGGAFYIFERKSALPRAFVVPLLEIYANQDELLDRLVAKDFDPGHRVLLIADQAEILGPQIPRGQAPNAKPAAERRVRFLRDEPTDVQLEVESGFPGYLVLTDTFMTGWSATLDGKPARMVRGDLDLRVLAVPAEKVRVGFRYQTPGLPQGAIWTLLSALLLLGLCLVSGRRVAGPTPDARSDR